LKRTFINSNPHLHKEKEMVDFRKAFLLLVVLAAVATMPLLAVDPMTCVASTGNPTPLRYEGVAEEVGQVTITCKGGTSTARGDVLPTVNVQIYLSTFITSKLLSLTTTGNTTATSPSEALLLLDEPSPRLGTLTAGTDGFGTGLQTVSQYVPSRDYPVAFGDGYYRGGSTETITVGGQAKPTVARPNVFVGQQYANNSVSWLNIPFDAPGTNGSRTLRIVNVRTNAYSAGSGNGILPSSIAMYITISGTASLSLSNPQLYVGYVQKGLTFGTSTYTGYYKNDNVDFTANPDGTTAATAFKQCNPPAGKYYSGTAGTYYLVTLDFKENFGSAFRQNITAADHQDVPGGIYNTESMFYNPDFASASGLGAGALAGTKPGLATNATQLIARFFNVPANVTLYVPYGTFYSTDYYTTNGVSYDRLFTVSGVSSNVLTLSGGSGSVTFEVAHSTSGAVSTTKIPVYVYYSSSALPDVGKVTVTGNYAPLSTTYTSSLTGLVPRFINDPQSAASFQIIYCQTNLLFPFVSSIAGFDTGFAISNTTADGFGTVAQQGPCTLNYYGTTGADMTGAAPGAQTSTNVASGSQLVFTLSGGGNKFHPEILPISGGFQGYVIASCAFQYAHGYAFLTGVVNGSTVAQGYLGLVMDSNFSGTRTGAVSEVLTH
jgi:hypothetical protein